MEEVSAGNVLQWDKTLNAGAYTVTMEVLDISNNNQIQTRSATVTISPCFIPINPHLRSSVVGN